MRRTLLAGLFPVFALFFGVATSTLEEDASPTTSLASTSNYDANFTQLMEGVEGLRQFLLQPRDSALSKSLHLLDELDAFATQSERIQEMIVLFETGADTAPPILTAGVAGIKTGLADMQRLAGQVLVELVDTLQEQAANLRQSSSNERGLVVDPAMDQESYDLEENATAVLVDENGKTTDMGDKKKATKKHPDPLHKLHANPKIRQHLQVQEALRLGDFSLIHRRVDNIHRRMTGHGVAEGQSQRRRQLQVEDEWEESCTRLVECVREYTLYDTIDYFYGPYINEDGEIDEGFPKEFLGDVWGIVDKVHDVLQKFEPTPRDTKDFRGQCSNLLQLFHRNEKFDDFVQYHPATWREVCRAEGTTKFIKFNEINEKLGMDVADQVFDDLARCATNLGEHLFFSKNGIPRVPLKVADVDNTTSRDEHGKAIIPTKSRTYFEMQYLSVLGAAEVKVVAETVMEQKVMSSYGPDRESWESLQDGWRPGSETTNVEMCMDLVDQHYRDVLLNASPNVFLTKKRLYPKLGIHCEKNDGKKKTTRKRELWSSRIFKKKKKKKTTKAPKGEYFCDVFAGEKKVCDGARFVDPGVCPATSRKISSKHTCTKRSHYELQTIFRSADDRDKASTLALGEKASVGLVCAYAATTKRTAGYCCLDAPYERSENGWGNEFTCDLGERACLFQAPKLAGFSEESCNVYSGKFCPHPRDCSSLKTCIAHEVEWATKRDKHAYRTYLIDAPEIKNPMSHDQCGSVREYFGFEADFPDDEELCEDIQLLRYNKGFDQLDENFSGSRSADEDGSAEGIMIGGRGGLADSGEARLADASNVYDGGKTKDIKDPGPPGVKKAALDTIALSLYQWAQSENALEEVMEVIGGFECPEDISGAVKSACAITKNAAFVIATQAKHACDRVFGAMENSEPEMTEYEHMEVREHALKVVENMKVLNDGIRQLKEQNAKNSKVIIEANGANTKAIIDSSSQNADAILDAATDLGKLVKSMCGRNRRDLELVSDLEGCHDDLVVSCWFDSPHASADRKTLFIEEGVRKVDTGIQYSLEHTCAGTKSVDVQVSVTSNELEEIPTAVLAKHRDQKQSEQPRIYVKPAICQENSVDFCVSDSRGMRFYEIELRADNSEDTCRVVVLPKGSEARELRGNAVRPLSASQERALVEEASNRFVVGELSLGAKFE